MKTIVAHPKKNQESLPDYVIKGVKASQTQVAEGKTTKYTTVNKLLGFN